MAFYWSKSYPTFSLLWSLFFFVACYATKRLIRFIRPFVFWYHRLHILLLSHFVRSSICFSIYVIWSIACTEMTKSKKIKILWAVHVVELSWAPIVITFRFIRLRLGCRTLPWTSHRSVENQKFQNAQIKILNADLKSAWKTVYWKCFSFFKIPSGSFSKSMLKIFKKR